MGFRIASRLAVVAWDCAAWLLALGLVVVLRYDLALKDDQWLARLGYRAAASLVAVSDGLAAAVAALAGRPVEVIPNVVREDFWQAPIRRPQGTSDPFTFLSVGYWDAVKGWDILMLAFSRLVGEGYSANLVLCGDSNPEIRAFAVRLRIEDRVRVTGRVPREEMITQMAACDCYVMPSRVETFGIASIEALACGKPVIMTTTDAAHAIITPDNGVVVPVEDVSALASALRTMVAKAVEYDPDSIRRGCYEKFSADAVVARLESVYQSALRPRRVDPL